MCRRDWKVDCLKRKRRRSCESLQRPLMSCSGTADLNYRNPHTNQSHFIWKIQSISAAISKKGKGTIVKQNMAVQCWLTAVKNKMSLSRKTDDCNWLNVQQQPISVTGTSMPQVVESLQKWISFSKLYDELEAKIFFNTDVYNLEAWMKMLQWKAFARDADPKYWAANKIKHCFQFLSKLLSKLPVPGKCLFLTPSNLWHYTPARKWCAASHVAGFLGY